MTMDELGAAPAPSVALVRVLDLTEGEAQALHERLRAAPGVRYVSVDAASGFVEVEHEPPFTEDDALEIVRATGKPVLSEFACC